MDNTNTSAYAELILTFAATVVAPCLGMAVKWFIDWRKIKLTDRQSAALFGAVNTASGLVLNSIRVGTLNISHLAPSHPAVQSAVNYVLERTPDAVKAYGFDGNSLGQMVVGYVSNKLHEDAQTPTVLPTPLPVAGTTHVLPGASGATTMNSTFTKG